MNPASDWFARGMETLRGRDQPSEGDVSGIIVRPCLSEVLGIDDHSIHAEQSSPGGRPDFVCRRQGRVELIVEVKNLDTNLERRYGSGWTTSPVGQLHKYMRRFPGVEDGTWGLLTNASEWRLFRRSPNDCILHNTCFPESLKELRTFLKPILEAYEKRSQQPLKEPPSNAWISRLQSQDWNPDRFVEMSAPSKKTDRMKDGGVEWVCVQLTDSIEGALFPAYPPSFLACIRLAATDGLIKPPDITEVMADMTVKHQSQVHGIAVVGGVNDSIRCCGFLRYNGELRTTATFDPHLPGSRIERQLHAIAQLDKEPMDLGYVKEALEILDRAALQEDFYTAIDSWFHRTNRTVNELRYLIQIMFAWLLQERGILPDTALWNHRPVRDNGADIHTRIEHLFMEVLAKEPDARIVKIDNHDQMPFLNGSLFTELAESDKPQQLNNSFYRSSQTSSDPGLLDILARYDWTLSEPTGSEMETALDPSMLGLLFERLMLSIRGPRIEKGGRNKKMPGGTYYTPQDVADEMVADAIAVRLSKVRDTPERSLRQLAHPVPEDRPWRKWPAETKDRVRTHLKDVTILDPCCGSGVFTVAMLQALQRCFRRLDDTGGVVAPEKIIEHQLHSADIEPLATLITRLRLFISIVEFRLREAKSQAIAPLPNLETRCVCADALHIRLSDQIAIADEDWNEGIGDLRAALEMWVSAYNSKDKQIAHDALEEARSRLRKLAALGMSTEWLETDLIRTTERPALVDLRLLLAVPDGWDIVIGNPPYQNTPRESRSRFKELGYRATSNLYTLFLEAALAATKSNGCIVMITPHSIVFKRQKTWNGLRERYERACEIIDLRTYDNRQIPVFPRLPWLKTNQSDENRQRVTILIARKSGLSDRTVQIFSRGLIRITKEDRRNILQVNQRGICQPPSLRQWTQAPTESTVKLLERMRDSNLSDLSDERNNSTGFITFPATAMYFVTCVPEGLINNESRRRVSVADDQFYWPWIGLYNSHLFHGYWLMMGDAFHLTDGEIRSIRAPLGWACETIRAETERLSRELCSKEIVARCRTVHKGPGGQEWPNANFHLFPADRIIEGLDRLLISAYGLEVEPLLTELRTMRIGSAHQIWARSDP